MLSFYYTTVVVISCLFVLSFLTILYLTYTQEAKTGGIDTSKPFPPVQQQCPDLWAYDPTGKTCTAKIDKVPGNNLNKNLGVFVNPNNGSPQAAEMAVSKNNPGSMVYTAPTTTTDGRVSFNPEDAFFSNTTSAVCGRKYFATEKNLTWEGVGNYNPC